MSIQIKTLGENIDDLVLTIARVAHCSTEDAVALIIHRVGEFKHEKSEETA
jgi:hypothetical protein